MIRKKERNYYELKDLQKFAEAKGGKCLSKEYYTFHEKHEWQCCNGHRWFASWCKIQHGKWCPYCCKQRYTNEEKCRYILKYFTGKEFKINRLILNNGQELDGYCNELNLAFEYNGSQHYKKHKFFHTNGQSLEQTQKRDQEKINKCKELNIKLIIIPHWICEKQEEILFIKNELEKNNINIIAKSEDFSYENFWKSTSKIEEIKEFARKKGGKLLSNVYLGVGIKMKWQCAKGHIFYSSWSNSRWSNRWCKKCANYGPQTGPTRRKTIEECQEIASKKNLIVLSKEYKNRRTKMEFECIKCGKHFNIALQVVIRKKHICC